MIFEGIFIILFTLIYILLWKYILLKYVRSVNEAQYVKFIFYCKTY